jgi:fibrillarin-like pre-rRNA processing protein
MDGADLIIRADGRLYTRNADPGVRVYGERLRLFNGTEYREWTPYRSKLSAYIQLGGKEMPFGPDSEVLYLGAASGTTASHISDIVPDGKVYCVEFSPRTFRDLVGVCGRRRNMVPILGDATQPESYRFAVGNVDAVYQDVAQKRQAEIFVANMDAFGAKKGMLCVKSRSEDVTARPERIFADSEAVLRRNGLGISDSVGLDPYEKDHIMIVAGR